MAQTWTDNPFSSGNVGQTDLQNIENNLLSLKSNFSGSSAPSNAVAGMHWYDSGAGNKVMKMYLDSAWVGYMHGDSSQKIPVFRNTAMDGWSIDSTAGYQDKVMAIKGGATYTTAGTTAGSWEISGLTTTVTAEAAHTHSHNHVWYDFVLGVDNDDYTGGGVSLETIDMGAKNAGAKFIPIVVDGSAGSTHVIGPSADMETDTDATAGSSHGHAGTTTSGDGSWRVEAAVFTLQYLDL